ncbi:MAG TPA: alpha/beta hydrolase-fold protein [Acidimicrobiia bacterium]|nr:alpha/beta hydrolase-fold protein [Acidimicrobiia bacterium]
MNQIMRYTPGHTGRRPGTATGIALALAGLVVAVVAPPGRSQAAEPSSPPRTGAVTALPAPFNQWDVHLGPRSGEDGALTLAYTSPALGRRTENTVYLPSRYTPDGPALPVLYFLHGTVAPPFDNPALHPATSQEFLLDMVASGGGDIQTRLEDFPGQRERARFVVVAPDTARADNWCQTCVWINGIKPAVPGQPPLRAREVPAETVLDSEVRPLVEHLFNVRTDRAGRGIIGFSMGAVGALIQILRHPDQYAYAAAISGPVNFVDDPFWRTWVDFVGYARDQGYGNSATDADRWRTFNPLDLMRNLAGTGTPVTITAGDACLQPTDEAGKQDCDRHPPVRNPFATMIETQMRRNNDTYAAAVAASGVDADQLRFSGIHGANNHRVYADVIVPAANAAFAHPKAVAETFSYRSGDPVFSVWGYTVDTHRPDFGVFTILDARHDGTAFAITGTGPVDVTTPATFGPGRPYSVTMSGSGAVSPRVVRADNAGRIRLDGLPLPPAGSAPNHITVTITPG